MLLSVSQNMTTDFKIFDIDFDRIEKLVALDNWHYSNIIWKDGYRKSDNYLPMSNCLIFDYDNLLSIAWVENVFRDYKKLICTTKSHLKEKNGIIAERFRLILPTITTIDLNKTDFVILMKYLTDRICSDTQATDAARKFLTAKDCRVIKTDGLLFDWQPFFNQATKAKEQAKQIKAFKKYKYRDSDSSILNPAKWAVAFKPEMIRAGSRNNELARIALWLKDEGATIDIVSDALDFVNDRLYEPLSSCELRNIVMSKFR